jgi:hypothetical protein
VCVLLLQPADWESQRKIADRQTGRGRFPHHCLSFILSLYEACLSIPEVAAVPVCVLLPTFSTVAFLSLSEVRTKERDVDRTKSIVNMAETEKLKHIHTFN